MEKIVCLASANYTYLALLIVPYLSYMLYDFMQPNMILSWYGDWLRKEENRNKEIEFHNELQQNDLEKGIITINEVYVLKKLKTPIIKKPLGLCLKCFHVWICIITFLILNNFDFLFFINLKFIFALSLSYGILVKEYY